MLRSGSLVNAGGGFCGLANKYVGLVFLAVVETDLVGDLVLTCFLGVFGLLSRALPYLNSFQIAFDFSSISSNYYYISFEYTWLAGGYELTGFGLGYDLLKFPKFSTS